LGTPRDEPEKKHMAIRQTRLIYKTSEDWTSELHHIFAIAVFLEI